MQLLHVENFLGEFCVENDDEVCASVQEAFCKHAGRDRYVSIAFAPAFSCRWILDNF